MHAHEHDATTEPSRRVGVGWEELVVLRAIDMCAL